MADQLPTRPDPAEAGLFSRPYAAVTASLAAVTFLAGFAALAVIPTLPVAVKDLHQVPLFPLVAGCFVAASLLGGVLGGDWADRVGARRPLAVGTVLAVVTLLVSAASTTVWQLAAGRFLDGIAAGIVAVAANAAIGQAFPERLRPRALALMSSCYIIPSLVGPPLAGLVATWWSWRAVFYGLAALNLLPALAVLLVLRGRSESGDAAAPRAGERPPRPKLLVAAAVSLGAALGQYAVSGWDLGHLLGGVAGLALLVAFAPRLLPSGTWTAVRGFPTTILLRGLGSGVYFTLEAFVPLLLDTVRRVPAAETGLAFTAAAIAWSGASWVQGRLATHRPRHQLVAVGALLLASAIAVAIVGTLRSTPAPTAGLAMVLAAVGMGLLAPSLTLLSLAQNPPDRQGYAGSAMQTAQNLGQIAVLGAASLVFNACPGNHATSVLGYAAAFLLLLVPALLAATLAPRTRATD